MEESEDRIGRARFLKRVGATLAAAVGAGALASRARATAGQCCRNCNCPSCGPTRCYCFCDCSGIGESYCWTAGQACLDAAQGCITCPC